MSTFQKGEIMGFRQNQSLDISEIVTETSTEPLPIVLEDDDKEVLQNLNGGVNTENTEKKIYYFFSRHQST